MHGELIEREKHAVDYLEQEILPIMGEWGGHFQLRDHQGSVMRSRLENPEHGVLYLLSDYMDPPASIYGIK